MLISEQLQTIKSDLKQIQNIKTTLNNDITSKLDSYKEQTNKTITDTLNTQSTQTKQTLQSHIDTQLNTAKNTLKTELTQSIANTATTLQHSLRTYAQGELLNKITEAKQEAIAKLDSTQIAEQIAQDENLKNHITQNIKTQTSEAIAEIDFKEPMRTIIEENLGKIPLNHAKIAEANLNALKPMILEQIENTIQTNTEAKFQEKIGDIDDEKIAKQFEIFLKTNAKELISNIYYQSYNLQASISMNALAQRHTYALIMNVAHQLLNDEFIKDLEHKGEKNNIYIVK